MRRLISRLLPRPVLALLRLQGGDAIIEMAVVIPAFFLLLFGIFQFSQALTSYLGVTYAIRQAARYAGTHSNTSFAPAATTDIQNMIKASPFVPGNAASGIGILYVTFEGATSGNYPGNAVYISIAYPQSISLPFYSTSFNVTSSTIRLVTR